MIKYIKAKKILSHNSDDYDPYFGIKYNFNLYRGCQHACIYCDSRSTCYQIENFSDIHIKENALELLEKELRSKRNKGTIGTGSMNDPYMPIEAKEQLIKGALEIIQKYRFPLHIITKSNLVLRDLELLKKINDVYAAVSLTITTIDDKLSKIIEPGAQVSSKRFDAIRILKENRIQTGIILTPVLPFITDDISNIENLLIKAKEVEVDYVIAWMGTTQREGQREYFYKKLDEYFPGIKDKYVKTFGNDYNCPSPNYKLLHQKYTELCGELGINTRMKFYKTEKSEQLNLL